MSSKVLTSRKTASNAKLFATRLEVSKVTNMDIKYIILITDSLGSARRLVDPSVHSEQAHSLAVCFAFRSFFGGSLGHKIKFWDY